MTIVYLKCNSQICKGRKGGAVLVKFVANIAKKSELCPIGVVNWRNVIKQVQADIVELIHGKFIIPDGRIDNDMMLKHVGKHRRQWKFELEAIYFNPTVRTRQQIENDNPGGIKYVDVGRKACAMLGRSTSFANSRDEFDIAKSKIDASVASSSSSKPRIEVEDQVSNELMYYKDTSNQKQVGYGFGVKRSDMMGVHALLRRKGMASEMNNDNNDLKIKFARHKKDTAILIMRLSSFASDLLIVVQSGHVSLKP
ncbi:G1/S-specific cyclin-E2 [Bienertia sinuspersici]